MTLTLTYQEYGQTVRPAANISDPFVFFLFSYSTESKAGPKDLKRRMENDHHRAFFRLFFFLHKRCLNNLTMAHQSFLQHLFAPSIHPGLIEKLLFITSWMGGDVV